MSDVDEAVGIAEWDPEDAKLVTLARGARARAPGRRQGAALRDETGRTYSGADVALDSLRLSAVQLVVAQAVASGSRGIEAVVVVGDWADETAEIPAVDLAAIAELAGRQVPLHACDADGTVRRTLQAGPPR